MAVRTLDTVLKWGTDFLIQKDIENASLDAWYLLEDVFEVSRLQFLMTRDNELSDDARIRRYKALIEKRSEGCPVQYLIGNTEFMGMTFEVDDHVLIPRQDTEILVETALSYIKQDDQVLDMCTGSGCIILSLAALGPIAKGTGVDISSEALQVAKRNRDRHKLTQVTFIQSDLFEKINEKYDMIISNPPYIPTEEIQTLMREVRNHEPMLALDGSEDGLYFYRKIAAQAGDYLVPGGMLLFEIGWNQAEDVTNILKENDFSNIHVKQDLSGLDRVVYAQKSIV